MEGQPSAGDVEEREREYQTEMIRLANAGNVIVCLPTGSGKTFIAVDVIKSMLAGAIRDKKKIIFVANKVHLVHQQGQYIQSRIGKDNDAVTIITGDLNTDHWSQTKWQEIINKHHILVTIDEILKQILTHSYIKFSQMALLIFDECHHATGNSPMAKIINSYHEKYHTKGYDRSSLPKILGLTATIINGAGKGGDFPMERQVQELEGKFCSRVITYSIAHLEDVKRYSTNAKIQAHLYTLASSESDSWDLETLVKGLRTAQTEVALDGNLNNKNPNAKINHSTLTNNQQLFYSGKTLGKLLRSCLEDVIEVCKDLGPYCAKLAARTTIGFLLSQQESDGTAPGIVKVKLVIKELEKFIVLIENLFSQFTESETLEIFISGKLRKLLEILMEWSKNGVDHKINSGIVFVEKRITAQVLHWYFVNAKKKAESHYKLLSTDFVIGCASPRWGLDYNNMHYTSKKQIESLQKFKNCETNLIFSTSVLEEGLDVRNCNLGIRFDLSLTFPSFVQSMGRVRKTDANFHVLINPVEKDKELSLLNRFILFKSKLDDYLLTRLVSTDDNETKVIINHNHGVLPFCPEGLPDSPRVTLDTAIQLVYRYCMTLPCDQLAPLYPYSWCIEAGVLETGPLFQAYLQFPSNSVIKTVIKGPVMKQKALAKQAVHLEACKQLYENEALDKNLLPIRSTDRIPKAATVFIQNMLSAIEEESKLTDKKVGSKKRVQWYPKKVPDFFHSKNPSAGASQYFLYRIKYCSPDTTHNNNLYSFENKKYSFGIVARSSLDVIPEFPLFGKFGTGYGSLLVRLEKLNYVELNMAQVESIGLMQNQLLNQIVRPKSPLLEKELEINTQFAVVPLVKSSNQTLSFEINWDFKNAMDRMQKFMSFPPIYQNESQITAQKCPNQLEDAIVYYTLDNQKLGVQLVDLHFVLEISDLTLNSRMDDRTNKTYVQHLVEKYSKLNSSGLDKSKFLLKTKNVGKQLNFLSTKVQADQVARSLKSNPNVMHFPQELVEIVPIPASAYIQTMLLPSTIHRIQRLLLSHEIKTSAGSKSNRPHGAHQSVSSDSDLISQCQFEDPKLNLDAPPPSGIKSIRLERVEIIRTSISNQQHPETIVDAPISLEYVHPDLLNMDTLHKKTMRQPLKLQGGNFGAGNHPRDKLSDINAINFKSMDSSSGSEPCSICIMKAMTLANANDSMSMEKLEFIGDSVLKFCSSLHIYTEFTQEDEGKMTNLRSHMVSNAYLYVMGKKKSLGEYLAGCIFVPDQTWTFPVKESKDETSSPVNGNHSFIIGSNNGNSTCTHARVGDKNIADSVEALIGANFVHGGLAGSLRFMAWLGITAPTSCGNIVSYDIINKEVKGNNKGFDKGSNDVTDYLPLIHDLENTICYRFENQLLLLEAFSYPDFVKNQQTSCYQRLEFLGDAVLDFLIARHIYDHSKAKNPGELTFLKSALVNNFTLASLAVRYNLHTYLLFSPSRKLQNAIDEFVVNVQQNCANKLIGDYQLKPSAAWASPDVAEITNAPKCLGDVFESLIGAIYIDCGRSLDKTWRIVYRLMEKEIRTCCENTPRNVVQELHELYQSLGKSMKLRVVKGAEKNKNPHGVHRTVVNLEIDGTPSEFRGAGVNKEDAKRAACQWAMQCKLSR